MSAWKIPPLRSKFTNISATLSEKVKLPERFKGTILERWSVYWKSLAHDYAEVGRGAYQTAKEKPKRTAVLGATALFAYLSAKKNPDDQSLITEIRRMNADMVMVHESCQRKKSADHLKMLECAINQRTLRTFDLGLLTIVWLHDFSDELCTYRALCKWLQPEWSTFHERIIDVGFWNKWWNLEKMMVDYDIPE